MKSSRLNQPESAAPEEQDEHQDQDEEKDGTVISTLIVSIRPAFLR
jgi:hypothetical protein